MTYTGCKQVIKTLRAALEALAIVAPSWLGGQIPPEWTRRCASAATTGGCQGRACPHRQATQVGRGGLLLPEAVLGPDAPAGLAGVEAVQVLRATWTQQLLP